MAGPKALSVSLLLMPHTDYMTEMTLLPTCNEIMVQTEQLINYASTMREAICHGRHARDAIISLLFVFVRSTVMSHCVVM